MTRKRRKSAFTLLELVVVLAILAVVTALALRAVDRVQDQKRYEAAQNGLQEIATSILGAPDDRAADGTRTVSGFVADMGRLPRAVVRNVDGTSCYTLAELWESGLTVPFDIRRASLVNLQAGNPADVDEQVLVPGGWRGPYLQLPVGTPGLLDGWGNPVVSPVDPGPPNPLTTGYARLRDSADQPISAAGQEIGIVRHLGANGALNPADTGYDRDEVLSLVGEPAIPTDDPFRAVLAGHIEVRDGDSPANPTTSPADTITIRIYGPSAISPDKISVVQVTVPFDQNPAPFPTPTLPFDGPGTIGPRVVRATYNPNGVAATSFTKSGVKQVTLRAGANLVELTIDR